MHNTRDSVKPSDSFELTLGKDHIDKQRLNIKASFKERFPKDNNTSIILVTDKGNIHAIFKKYESRWSPWIEKGGLPNWFDTHKELIVGSKVLITIINPRTKYSLEIIK